MIADAVNSNMKSLMKHYHRFLLTLEKKLTRNVHDCLVCALRPAIFFGMAGIYFGLPVCTHVNRLKKSGLIRVNWLTGIPVFFNIVLLLDLLYVFEELHAGLPYEKMIDQILRIAKTINVILYSISLLLSQKKFQEYINYFIGLIENRKKYGIDILLDTKTTLLCQMFSYCTILLFVAFTAFYTFNVLRNLNFQRIVQLVAYLFILYKFFYLTLYFFTTFEINSRIFHTIFSSIRGILTEAYSNEQSKSNFSSVPLIDRL